MKKSFSSIDGMSTETVFNIEDQLEDILNSLNTDVFKGKAGYQVYLMLFHYKDNCFYNYSKRRYIWENGEKKEYNPLDKLEDLFRSNFDKLDKHLLKNYKFNGGKDFIENNLKKISDGETEYIVCKKLLSFLKNKSDRKKILKVTTGCIMEYIKKCLEIDSDQILKDSLLKIFRSLPQPKNALIAGWMYSYISQKNTGNNTTNNTNCFKVLNKKNNIIFIPNMNSFWDKYKNKLLQNTALQYYLEDCYPLAKFLEELLVTGGSLEIDALMKMSAVLFPLYDFGQFRGLIYVVTDNEYIDQNDCDSDNSTNTESLKKEAESITEAILGKQEQYRLKIRNAMECELNKRVFKDNLEDDVYTKILRNVHLVQNILLGVYSRFEDNGFKAVAMRSFKKLGNDIPQLVYLGENDLKNKEKITFGNGQPAIKITDSYCKNLKNIIEINNPKVSYAEDGPDDFLIPTNPDYCKDIGSEIGLEILVPVVADGKLKGAFDLYYPPMKDTVSNDSDVRAIVEHLRTFLSLGGVHDEMVTRVAKHSIKAAVSAIISRNHSHHIGSHVTPRSSVEKISERLEAFDSKKTEIVNCKLKLRKKEIEFKFVNLLKNRLDEYIQKKADFTAEIATEPLITTKSLSFVREIFIPLLKNTLLMDGIGANEEVQYRSLTDNRLKVKCFLDSEELDFSIKPDCTKNHTYKYYNYPYNGHCECVNACELKIIEEDFPDKKIALPGPLGEFSFYCFMENFIRNAIKHNRTKLDQNKDSAMEIFVNLEELDKNHPDRDEFYKIQVWDNMTNPCESRTISINGEEKTVTLKDMIAHLIKQPIVDNDGGLKKGAWGIAEMKIMATLLRGSTDFVNMVNNLKVCCHNKDGKERLVYALYVMKAKHSAIITNNNFDNDTKENLKKNSIWIFKDLNEFDTHITGGKSPASFKFVLLDLIDIGENVLSKFLPKFPFRIFTKEFLDENKFKIENSIGSSDEAIEEFKRKIWKVYLKNLFDKKNLSTIQIDLILFLQQAKSEFPTNEWEKLKNQGIKEPSNLNLKVISIEDRDNSVCLNSNLSLMYDRHAGGYKKIKKSDRDNIYFYESFDKNSHDFTSIFLKPESEEMIYELAEAAILRVLVIDERVAERAHEKIKVEDSLKKFYGTGNSKPNRIQIARKAKVYFCTHLSMNGDKRPLHNKAEGETPSVEVKMSVSQNDEFCIDSFEVMYGNSKLKENEGTFDIVIIHQGVLEEFVKKVLGSYSYEEFLKALRKHIQHIIVTSGRGIPPNLPKSAKFIPFSLLQDYLLRGGIAKYNLVKIVTELIRRDV